MGVGDRPDGKTFVTIYAGTDDMNYSAVDRRRLPRDRAGPASLTVGKHPRAVRYSPDGKEVYVYTTLDFSVTVYDTTASRPAKVASIKVCDPPQTPEWVRGKELFVTAQSPMTRSRWIACSSCHPDGAQTAGSGRTPRARGRRRRCSAWPTRTRCTGRPTATRCRTSSTRSAAS